MYSLPHSRGDLSLVITVSVATSSAGNLLQMSGRDLRAAARATVIFGEIVQNHTVNIAVNTVHVKSGCKCALDFP